MARKSASSGVFWQVVAPWVRWPLASPRRLTAVVVSVVATLILISTVNGRSGLEPAPSSSAVTEGTAPPGHSGGASVETTSPASTVSAIPSSTTSRTSSPGQATSTPAQTIGGSADEVAGQFVRLWARPEVTQPGWSQALTPLASAAYGAELATVLPSNVPAHAVTAVAPPVSEASGTSRVIVTTDVGTIAVSLAEAPGSGWKVQSVAPGQLAVTGAAGSTVAPTYTPMPSS